MSQLFLCLAVQLAIIIPWFSIVWQQSVNLRYASPRNVLPSSNANGIFISILHFYLVWYHSVSSHLTQFNSNPHNLIFYIMGRYHFGLIAVYGPQNQFIQLTMPRFCTSDLMKYMCILTQLLNLVTLCRSNIYWSK